MNIFVKFLQHNWFATLYFNFRMLPFKQAIRLPFDFYHDVRFDALSGKVVLDTEHIYRGIVKIGGRSSDIFPRQETVMSIKGTAIFKGQTEIGNGASFVVLKDAQTIMGNKVRIGAYSKLYCAKSITFGNEIGLSWECQIFDTNFHDMVDISSGKFSEQTSSVTIGSYNWFGNRCNIMKGTITPNNIIVASNSLLNKDYRAFIEEHSLLAGTPAKVIRTGIKRIYE